MKKTAGNGFPLHLDTEILKIDSPRRRLRGPWCVVHKEISNRWAIVAMDWDSKPVLGIRWFYGKSGTPISSSYATWFVIPLELNKSILDSLELPQNVYDEIQRFLDGKITGDELHDN